jgi:hypothetical protein
MTTTTMTGEWMDGWPDEASSFVLSETGLDGAGRCGWGILPRGMLRDSDNQESIDSDNRVEVCSSMVGLYCVE